MARFLQNNGYIFIILFVLTFIVLLNVFYFFGQEILLKRHIYFPDDAQFQYQAAGHFSTDIRRVSFYYLIPRDLDSVGVDYEHYYGSFLVGNPENEWITAGIDLDGVAVQLTTLPPVIGHGTLCDYRRSYGCLSVTLIDLSKQNVKTLPVVTPSNFFPEPTSPLYKFIDSLPFEGTLAIYTYFAHEF
jgi:hypothetical protein